MLPLLASATEISADLRAGRYSSRELVEAYAARIGGIGRSLNAVVALRIEKALAEATAADEARAAGRDRGPLAGVPITIKDSFETEGLLTTSGSPTSSSTPFPSWSRSPYPNEYNRPSDVTMSE